MELQNSKLRFEEHGIKLAAISYDTPAILKDFSRRHKIEFPVLADPDSKIIRSFNALNAQASGTNKGMAHPGFFYIDSSAVVREKYFETKETDRFTPNNVIGKLFLELTEEVSWDIDAPHLRLTLEESDREVISGNRVTLIAQIELPPNLHVYSPGAQGYKPIQLTDEPGLRIQYLRIWAKRLPAALGVRSFRQSRRRLASVPCLQRIGSGREGAEFPSP